MTRQNPVNSFAGRPTTAPCPSFRKAVVGPNGTLLDVTPAPGRTFTKETWPPRGRGRGESLISPRRIEAKLRTVQVIQMRREHSTWQHIADVLGFKDASGPYRAWKRASDRVDWIRSQQEEEEEYTRGAEYRQLLELVRAVNAELED